jgi:hypothetical protein
MNTRTALRRMAAQAFPDDERLRRMVPEAERAHGLHRILGDPRLYPVPDPVPRGRRWGPVLVVGVVVVAVLAAVAVFVLPGPVGERPLPEVAGPAPAPTLTTGADPAEVLGRLADRAAAQPPLPAEPFDYMHSVGWGLTESEDGLPVRPEEEDRGELESWLNADGLGRLRHWGGTTGNEVYDSGADRPVDLVGESGWVPRVADLPTDPAALEAALLALRQAPYEVTLLYDLMVRTWGYQVLEPQQQAAFLRLLATKDDVRVLGPATDRVGRGGIAVVLSQTQDGPIDPTTGLPYFSSVVTNTLILDQQTGALLSAERVETEGDGSTVSNTTVLLATGRVGSIAERP